jgi:hypothetical protein
MTPIALGFTPLLGSAAAPADPAAIFAPVVNDQETLAAIGSPAMSRTRLTVAT